MEQNSNVTHDFHISFNCLNLSTVQCLCLGLRKKVFYNNNIERTTGSVEAQELARVWRKSNHCSDFIAVTADSIKYKLL